MQRFLSLLFCLFSTFPIFSQTALKSLSLANLRCEYRVNPLGIDKPKPRFNWELRSSVNNTVQTAYRLVVASAPSFAAGDVIWDSGKVSSSASVLVPYAGAALEPARGYFWKVMSWDNHGRASAWAPAASFSTGLFAPADWKEAAWIAYDRMPDSLLNVLPTDGKKDRVNANNILPILRKEFSVKARLKSATAFVSGLGHFELSLNGKKAGDHFLDAGWTRYDKQALYVTFDIKRLLKQGTNAAGVMLGNGFHYVPPVKGRYRKLKSAFGFPKLIARIRLEYEDGTIEDVVTDRSWKAAPGPIVFSSIYGGEDYNAGLEQAGWNVPGFNDRSWQNAILVPGPPELNSQMAEPLKVQEKFEPRSVTRAANGHWVYDLGQNASGIIRLSVKGRKGDTIRIVPAELLNGDGSVNQRPIGSPYYFQYILKGSGVETWEPRFSYSGFRYLEVEGGVPRGKAASGVKAGQTEILLLQGLHTRNSAAATGTFQCSSELFNKTYSLIDWAVKSNMASVLTDCPHREKLGWLEQVHLMGPSLQYAYDIANLSRKTLRDMMDSQLPDGLVPEIAPEYVKFEWGGDMFRDSPEWGSSAVLLPWYMYQWYADEEVLHTAYPMMQKYLAYLQTKAKNHILYQGLGDWYDLGPRPPGVSQLTPNGVTGTAIYYYDLVIMSRVATLLGKTADAETYTQLAAGVREAFNLIFFNPVTNQYASGSQTANAMAIYTGLVPDASKQAVLENLVADIRRRNNALTAGDIGYRYVLRVLEQEGRPDVIFDMNSRSDVPGYGYQLAKGATALTESWAALPTVSNNHLMLGHLMEWFYSGLGGIRLAEGGTAFNHFLVRPEPAGDVRSARTNFNSPYGPIRSEWSLDESRFSLNVEVPANTTCTLYLPARPGAPVLSNGEPVAVSSYEKGRALISLGSGKYSFLVK
jgi:alpha-L-rhamnosidase